MFSSTASAKAKTEAKQNLQTIAAVCYQSDDDDKTHRQQLSLARFPKTCAVLRWKNKCLRHSGPGKGPSYVAPGESLGQVAAGSSPLMIG